VSLASEDSPAGRPASTAAAAGWIAGAAVFLVSVLGLLCLRMDFFDDSAMVLGARLVRAGKLPYLDFYTHYGPLGFSLLGGFLSLRVNPGVAFRVAQSCGLLAAAILLWVLARRFRAATGPGFLVALALLALSAVFQLPAFFGFLFAFAAAGLFLLSGTARNRPARSSLVLAAAASLAAAALTRPVFGVYALAPVLVAAVVDEIDRTRHASRRAASLLVGGGLLWTFLLWIVLYARIPARIAIDAALIEPAKLVEGGGRFLRPSFFPFVPTGLGRGLATFCGGAVILGASAAWALNLPSRGSRRAMAAVCFAGGVGSVLLALSPAPGRHATLLALAAFLLIAGLTWVCRSDLRGSGAAAAAAFFGVFSAAFGHYFWQRPDRPHLIPLLALSALALLLAGAESRPRGRAAGLAVLILAYVSV
jgi:hypothetical protein